MVTKAKPRRPRAPVPAPSANRTKAPRGSAPRAKTRRAPVPERAGARHDAVPSPRRASVRRAAGPAARDADPARLHPAFRSRVLEVVRQLQAEGLPFRIFEAWRSPERQRYLYEQGRTRPGAKVTNAQAWESYHQYGLAADLVLYENGAWSWETRGPRGAWWTRMHAIARAAGLEPLSFEMPHVQLAGTSTAALRAGRYPAGGDDAWSNHLAHAIYAWQGTPAAPPQPAEIVERPPLAEEVSPGAPPAGITLAPLPAEDWHSRFGGIEWRHDAHGVYVREHRGGRTPLRTDGDPVTARRIWALFREPILAASAKHGVPVPLILMVIATETAAYRRFGFTGPFTFRWEPHVEVKDVTPPVFGDYSAGPMQVLATTARWVIRAQRLDYDAFAVARAFERRPEPPDALPMYDPAISIDLGAAVIRQRMAQTGDDPILVAAAYNAGSLRRSAANAWHLHCYGDHLDRAAKWYGDACFVLAEAGAHQPVRARRSAQPPRFKKRPVRERGSARPGRAGKSARRTA